MGGLLDGAGILALRRADLSIITADRCLAQVSRRVDGVGVGVEHRDRLRVRGVSIYSRSGGYKFV